MRVQLHPPAQDLAVLVLAEDKADHHLGLTLAPAPRLVSGFAGYAWSGQVRS